ncbi:hypothetical protein [Microcoleus sp. S13C4]|uniref:hypothetical protein n=1 Tax=Microcoleus sp. S13C4 TaxID=3055410 RepID=UPI002FD26FB0
MINTVTNLLLDSFQFAIGLDSSSGFYANAFVSNSFKPTQINFNFLAQESAAASLLYTSGVYSRTFNSPTNLRLVEVKNNIAKTEAEAVPEPNTVLGTAIFLGLFVTQRKHKKTKSEVKSKV